MRAEQPKGDEVRELEPIWRKVCTRYPEANFLQSPAWLQANRLMGNHPVVIEAQAESWCVGIIKDARRGRYLEIPGGPLIDWSTQAEEMMQKIRAVAEREHCVFVRMRPQLRATAENRALLERLALRKAPMHLHAEHTVMIDLAGADEAGLLAAMRKQTRYEVRRAEKLGIKVWRGNSEELFKEFHAVQVETAKRQNFVPPSLKVLLAEREAFQEQAQIYVADSAEGERICYGLILLDGAEAEYFEAASTNLGRTLPGAYSMLWHAMCELKQQGIKRFNLWGIAPAGATHHRYSGVTVFKKGFGGEVVEFMPAQDLVIKPLRYRLDYWFESLRRKCRGL